MGKIEVYFTQIKVGINSSLSVPLADYHLTVVWTNDAGKSFYLKGGPSSGAGFGSDANNSGSSGISSGGAGPNFPFGNLYTQSGVWAPAPANVKGSTPTYTSDYQPSGGAYGQPPPQVVLTAPDSVIAPKWNNIVNKIISQDNALHIPYNPTGVNSNAAAAQFLSLLGASQPNGIGLFGGNPAPGYGVPLANQSGGTVLGEDLSAGAAALIEGFGGLPKAIAKLTASAATVLQSGLSNIAQSLFGAAAALIDTGAGEASVDGISIGSYQNGSTLYSFNLGGQSAQALFSSSNQLETAIYVAINKQNYASLFSGNQNITLNGPTQVYDFSTGKNDIFLDAKSTINIFGGQGDYIKTSGSTFNINTTSIDPATGKVSATTGASLTIYGSDTINTTGYSFKVNNMNQITVNSGGYLTKDITYDSSVPSSTYPEIQELDNSYGPNSSYVIFWQNLPTTLTTLRQWYTGVNRTGRLEESIGNGTDIGGVKGAIVIHVFYTYNANGLETAYKAELCDTTYEVIGTADFTADGTFVDGTGVLAKGSPSNFDLGYFSGKYGIYQNPPKATVASSNSLVQSPSFAGLQTSASPLNSLTSYTTATKSLSFDGLSSPMTATTPGSSSPNSSPGLSPLSATLPASVTATKVAGPDGPLSEVLTASGVASSAELPVTEGTTASEPQTNWWANSSGLSPSEAEAAALALRSAKPSPLQNMMAAIEAFEAGRPLPTAGATAAPTQTLAEAVQAAGHSPDAAHIQQQLLLMRQSAAAFRSDPGAAPAIFNRSGLTGGLAGTLAGATQITPSKIPHPALHPG